MPLKAYVGGVAKNPASATARVSGATKSVRRIEVYDDGAWHVGHSFIGPVSLSISPGDVSVDGDGSGIANLETPLVTATPSGGLGPFTYAWTRTGGTTASATSPTAANTSFLKTSVPPGSTFYTANFQCLCTDSLGQTATASCTATFRNSLIT